MKCKWRNDETFATIYTRWNYLSVDFTIWLLLNIKVIPKTETVVGNRNIFDFKYHSQFQLLNIYY